MPPVSVVEATGAPWAPKGLTSATPRAGSRPLCTTLHEATLPAAPTEVTGGCEATGPDGLSLSEARIAQGYRVLVLTPFDVKARRGTTRRGTTTDPVDARLLAELRQREHVPSSPVPEARGRGCARCPGGGPIWWRRGAM
jgi:Transposase